MRYSASEKAENQEAEMVRVQGLDHIVLRSPDVERSIEFYNGVLGMPVVRADEWRAGKVRFPSIRLNEGTIIDLFPAEPGESFSAIQQLAHFCMVLEPGELDGAKNAIKAAGIEIEIEATRWGARGNAESFYFQGPEGVQIELREYPA
jgi:catechol 2,3-dioxygenase-like lactoylglutathione lyase family enzyme